MAQRLRADFAKEGADAWLDTQRIAGGTASGATIEHEVDTRQVTLALLSPGSDVSGICSQAACRENPTGLPRAQSRVSLELVSARSIRRPGHEDFSHGAFRLKDGSHRSSTSYLRRKGNRCWTSSFTTASPEDFLSTSRNHLPVWSFLNLMRVWRANRAAVTRPMVDGSR